MKNKTSFVKLLSICSLALLLSVFACLAIACDKKTESYKLAENDYGVYLTDTTGYVLTITDKDLTLENCGKKQTVDFQYQDKSLVAQFNDGKATVTVNNGTVALDLNGNKYSLTKKQTYKLTFVTDGTMDAKVWTVAAGWVINEPTTTKSGYIFDGWYTTSGCASKYDFTKAIAGDTSIYAKFDADLQVTVTENNVSWQDMGVGSVYGVEVYMDDGTDAIETTTVETANYTYAYTDAGVYKFVISYKNVSGEATYAYHVLGEAKNLKVEGNLLKFDGVENADSYKVIVVANGDVKTVDIGAATQFDFSDYELDENGIAFTVKANKTGWISSEVDYECTRKLDAVKNLVATDSDEDYILTWDAVTNADYYLVKVLAGTKEYKVKVADNKVSLKEYKGNISVSVEAVAKAWITSDAGLKDVNNAKLDAPQNVAVKGNTLTWDEVASATGYVVKVDGVAANVATNEYDITNVAAGAKIQVMAVGGYLSNVVELANTLTATYKDGVISWKAIKGVTGYTVKANDGTDVSVYTNYVDLASLNSLVSGKNTIVVSDGTNSSSIDVDLYKVTFDAKYGVEVAPMFVASGDKVNFKPTTRAEYEFIDWYNGDAKYDSTTFTQDADITLTAKWEGLNHEVTLNLGDQAGTISLEGITVKFKTNYVLPVPVATNTAYVFNGWMNGTKKYTDENGVSLGFFSDTTDVELTASWVMVLNFVLNEDKVSYAAEKTAYTNWVKELTIPAVYNDKPVTKIYSGAFDGCNKLEVINIPNTIDFVESGLGNEAIVSCFANCSALKELNVYKVESVTDYVYESFDGMLIYINKNNSNKKEIQFIPASITGVVEIPEGVEVIPAQTFYKATGISEVVIPCTVSYIEAKAFAANYYTLTKITFLPTPAGSTEVPLVIGDRAFANILNLRSVTLPKRLSGFDVPEEDETDALGTVQGTITAFYYDNKLTEINVEDGCEKYYSLDGVLYEKATNSLVLFPCAYVGEFRIPAAATKVANGAFTNSKISKLVVPGHVEYIGAGAFMASRNLKTVVFEGTSNDADLVIDRKAFYSCPSITALYLPANLKTLEKQAFGADDALFTVTFECGADAEIKDGAFYNNKDSSQITTINIGKNCPAFSFVGVIGSDYLDFIYVDKNNTNIIISESGVYYNADKSKIIFFPRSVDGQLTLADGLTEINDGLFKDKTLITKVTIGKDVNKIGDRAFEGCIALEEVVFEEGNTNAITIGKYAFSGCTKLSTINLPSTVKTIGDYAFSGCSAITEITVPTSLTTVGRYAFSGTKIATFDASASALTLVGDYAFNGVTTLTAVKFPNTVDLGTTEPPRTNDLDFSIYSDTKYEITHVFEGCTNLAEISIPEGGANFVTIQDVVFKLDGGVATNIYFAPMKAKGVSDASGVLSVPSTITRIEDLAFYKNTVISSITFGEGVGAVDVMPAAFRESSITTFAYPEGSKVVSRGTFYNCTKLTSVTIPGTVELIEKTAFSGCILLATVTFTESEVKVPLVFADCSSATTHPTFYKTSKLTSIALPERTTEIGKYVFAGNSAAMATKLTSITIPKNTYRIGEGAFQFVQSLTALNYADGCALTGEDGIVEKNAFYNTKIKNLTVIATHSGTGAYAIATATASTTLTINPTANLDSKMFYYSASVYHPATTVTFAEGFNKTAIPDYAFYYSKKMTKIEIPASVKTIGSFAFSNCSVLATVTFAEGSQLDSIGDNAFEKTVITSFTLPTKEDGTINLGKNLFSGDTKALSISFSKNVPSIDKVFDGYTSNKPTITIASDSTYLSLADGVVTNKVTGEIVYIVSATIPADGVYTIPANMTKIGLGFQGNTSIKELIIPNTVTSIEAYAFKGCTALTKVTFAADCPADLPVGMFSGCTSLAEVTLPSGVSIIPNEFFKSTAFTSIELPTSVEKIGNNAFESCTKLVTADIKFVDSIGASAFSTCSALQNLYLSDSLSEIGNSAFKGIAITSVVIPANVATVGTGVFENCTKLVTLDFANNSQLELLAGTFCKGCTALTTINLPTSIKMFGNSAFENCKALVSVDLSKLSIDGFRSTQTAATSKLFYNCSALTTVQLPVGIKYLGTYTFGGTAIASFTIPDTVKGIGNYVVDKDITAGMNDSTYLFQNCKKLTTVVLPNTLEHIGGYVFSGCTELTTINIPDSVKVIDQAAFQNCSKLELELTLGQNFIFMGKNAFNGSAIKSVVFNCTLTEPDACKVATSNACEGMFAGCTKLASVTLPDGMKYIYSKMFYNCTALTEITLPETIQAIMLGAFAGSGLTSITIPARCEAIGCLPASCDGIVDPPMQTICTTNIGGGGVFKGCKSLATVTFAEGSHCTTFTYESFAGCTSLKDIVLPADTKNLGSRAFAATGLTESDVEIPKNLQITGTNLFAAS